MKDMINLYNGDSLEVMDRLIEQGVTVDAIITDPPYGTTACKWDNVIPFVEMWLRLNKLIKPNGAIILFGSEPFSSALRMSNIKNYKYDWKWIKNRPSGMSYAKYQPMRACEDILIFNASKENYNPIMIQRTEKELKRFNKHKTTKTSGNQSNGLKFGMCKTRENSKYKYPNNILDIKTVSNSSREKTLHPTQKPVELMKYLIKTYTKENETVLDFTMGSGTTGVACKNTNRNFIGIELDEKYFDIAKNRINEFQGSLF